jgi:hypothetical protein
LVGGLGLEIGELVRERGAGCLVENPGFIDDPSAERRKIQRMRGQSSDQEREERKESRGA